MKNVALFLSTSEGSKQGRKREGRIGREQRNYTALKQIGFQ
jgi:hypothetical protein